MNAAAAAAASDADAVASGTEVIGGGDSHSGDNNVTLEAYVAELPLHSQDARAHVLCVS